MAHLPTQSHGRPGRRTIIQWITVALLSISGLMTMVTGIYFLFMPSGGYQGGRNAGYGTTFLFDRDIWKELHIWGGMIMVAVALIHIALHWRWLVEMGRRTLAVATGRRKPFAVKIWTRLSVITAVGAAFLVVAVSGVYFFLVPGGNHTGRSATEFLLSRATWSDLHTWVGVAMIVFAVAHLVMRWKWVARVTPNLVRSLV